VRKKLRQKKVDVLLAVEALDHAFRGNRSLFLALSHKFRVSSLLKNPPRAFFPSRESWIQCRPSFQWRRLYMKLIDPSTKGLSYYEMF